MKVASKAVAVLVAPDDHDDLERLLLSRSHQRRALLEQARASLREGQGLGHEEFWATVDQEPAK